MCSSPSTSPTSTRRSPSTRSCSPPSRTSASPATPTSPSPTRRSSSCCSRRPAPTRASTTSASRSTSSDEVRAHQARLDRRGARAGRRERHLLLRQAGQGVGRRTRRRLGDLHRARGQRHLRQIVRHASTTRPADSLCCASVARGRGPLLLMADAALDRAPVDSPAVWRAADIADTRRRGRTSSPTSSEPRSSTPPERAASPRPDHRRR